MYTYLVLQTTERILDAIYEKMGGGKNFYPFYILYAESFDMLEQIQMERFLELGEDASRFYFNDALDKY